jgi:hypothetical protein
VGQDCRAAAWPAPILRADHLLPIGARDASTNATVASRRKERRCAGPFHLRATALWEQAQGAAEAFRDAVIAVGLGTAVPDPVAEFGDTPSRSW